MTLQYLRQALVSVAVATAALGLFASAVQAQEGPKLAMQPVTFDPAVPETAAYFVLNAQPGVTIRSEVRVMNNGRAAGTVRLYPVDAVTGRTSGTVFPLREDSHRNVGSWLVLGAEELVLQPGESQVVPFSVTIPDDARPGEHVGGIVAEDVELRGGGGKALGAGAAGMHVKIRNRVAVAVQVNLPGPVVEQLEITGITPGGRQGYQTLVVGMRNSGTVMLKPSGSLQVRDERGEVVQDLKLTLDTFLPQNAIEYPVLVADKALAPGDYSASIALSYGSGRETRYTALFSITSGQIAQVFEGQKPLPPPTAPQAGTTVSAPTGQSPWLLLALGAGGMFALMLAAVLGFVLYQRDRRAANARPGAPIAEPRGSRRW